MTDQLDGWPASRIRDLIGVEVSSLQPIGGAGFGRPYRADLTDGRQVFVKADRDAALGFFDHEAWGLRWLGEVTEGARVATVVAAGQDMLILDWVPSSGIASRAAAADFGRRLAITHAAGAPGFGRPVDSVLASESLPGGEYADWPTFYAEARLIPFLDRAVAAGHLDDHDQQSIRRLIGRLPELAGPSERPARLHGDLWSGNVIWSDREAVMVDPAAYGGHRETDLAMLALFGLPHLDVALDAYQSEHPLAAGWQQRVALHQLFPLLVHAVIFGGSYGAAAGDAARRFLH
ncbi:MAG TPA: fructosamine kinase family protein [Microlunatus sp.]